MADDQQHTSSVPTKNGLPADARERLTAQHDRFGGINWGAAFFGWLSANGLAVLLLAIISAAGLAIGLTDVSSSTLQRSAESAANGDLGNVDPIGLAGGIAVLVVLALAYFAGGYVAGRMSRFDGVRQGFAVWLIGLFVVVGLAALAAAFGAKYNVLARLNLPRIPIDEGTATTGGVIALVAVLLIAAVAAGLGGRFGERYHRRIDRATFTG
jgi:hypothetical protein